MMKYISFLKESTSKGSTLTNMVFQEVEYLL